MKGYKVYEVNDPQYGDPRNATYFPKLRARYRLKIDF
jgi:hypothetical protein